MGFCCANEQRKLDTKEARLDVYDELQSNDYKGKKSFDGFSTIEQDSIFESESKKMKSINEQVNVNYF